MTTSIEVGTRVAYSHKFMQDAGSFTGPMPFRRGVVTELQEIGSGIVLATIAWDGEGVSRGGKRAIYGSNKARVRILVREDRLHLEPQ